MKKKIQYLKTLEYFIRSIKKRICKTEKFKFSKACSFMHSILGWGSFCTNSSISEEWHGSDQPVPLLRHYWVFSSSGLLDRLFLIFLLKISHRFHMGSNQAQLCHGQQTTWKPFQTLISKWNSKITFIWKEDFGPLSNSPVLFLLSTGKMLLTKLLISQSHGSNSMHSGIYCICDEEDLLKFKPSIRTGKKGDLSDFERGCCWCQTSWSEYFTNCWSTGIFTHNYL